MKNSYISTWQIEHQCPQCGAPVTLDETDRLFSCPFCRIKLYLVAQDYFKYYLSSSASSSRDIIFVPYWRFKGMAFFCKANEIKYKVIDTNFLASDHTSFPPSMGFRPQVLKLKFISPEIEGRFFKSHVPLKTVFERIEREAAGAVDSATKGSIFHKAFIGETVSLIHSPVFIQGNMFFDAILKKPQAPLPKDFVDDLFPFDQQKDWQIKFVSTLCPHCGWDLSGETDSVVLLCKNCDSAWKPSTTGSERLEAAVIPGRKDGALYLPFWRMKAQIDGFKVQSYADLLRFANVPKIIKKEWDKFDAYFWAPAFKVSPELFLRSARSLTLSPPQPQEQFENSLPKTTLYSVNLPIDEAAESIKLTIANIATDKKDILPRLAEINILLNEVLLVYLPFILSGGEFIHPETQLCIHKNSLQFGRNL